MGEPTPNQLSDQDAPENDEESLGFDVETALLALSEDLSGPTVDIDLGALSPDERRFVLHCLRERLDLHPSPPEPE